MGGNGGRQVGQILRGCALQLFVRPKGGENAFIRGTWNKNGPENTKGPSFQAEKVTPFYWDDVGADLLHDESDVLDENSMEIPLKHCKEKGIDKAWECAEELKAELQELGMRLKVDHLVADFVLDDNDKLWLSAVHDVIKVDGGWSSSSSNQVEAKKSAACTSSTKAATKAAARQKASGDHSYPDEGAFDRMQSTYGRATERGRFGPRRRQHSMKASNNVETEACPPSQSSPSFTKEISAQQQNHRQLKESVAKEAGKATNLHGSSPKHDVLERAQAALRVLRGGGATSSLKAANEFCLKENKSHVMRDVNAAPKVGGCCSNVSGGGQEDRPSSSILKERITSLEAENAMLKLKAKAEVALCGRREANASHAVSNNFEQLLAGQEDEPSSSIKACMEMTEQRRALAEETAVAAQRELATIRQRLSKVEESGRRQQEATSRAIFSALEKAEALAESDKIALETRLNEEKRTEMESLICKMETERTESETNLRFSHSGALADLHEKMTSMRSSFCDDIKDLKARWEAERLHLASMALEQAEKRATDAACAAREEWEIKAKEIQDAAEQREAQALDKAAAESNAVVSEMQAAFKSERARWERDLRDTVAKATAEESERWKVKLQETIEKLKKQWDLEAEKQVKEALEHERIEWVTRIEEEKRNFAAMQAEKEEQYAHLESAKEEARNSEMMELRDSLSEEKANTLSLETDRIKCMLKDAEEKASADADAASARAEGRQEGIAQYRMELEEKEKRFEDRLLELRQQNVEVMEKLSKQHEDELSQVRVAVREEAEAEVSKVVEKVKAVMNEELNDAVKNAKTETRLECRKAAGKERQRSVEATKQKAQLDVENAAEVHRIIHLKWTIEKGDLKRRIKELEELNEEARKSVNIVSKDAAVAIERAQSRLQESLGKAAERAASEALIDREEAVAEVRRAMTKERIRAVQNALREGERKTAEAKASVTLDAERKLAVAASDVMELKDQLELSEYQLNQLKSDYQSLQDKAETFHLEIGRTNVEQSIRRWQSLVWHFKKQTEWEQKEALAEKRFISAEEDGLKRLKKERGALESEIEILLKAVFDAERGRVSLQDILVNHKREVLLSHKMQVASLQKDMETLLYNRTFIEETLNKAALRVKEAEDKVRDIEREIAAHARQSCVGPDGISLAHKHRKRRLNEELELCMEKVEAEKAREVAARKAHAEAENAQNGKQDEARKLEQHVVQILVEQQKKLLTTLNRMASQNGEHGVVLEKIHERHKAAVARAENTSTIS